MAHSIPRRFISSKWVWLILPIVVPPLQAAWSSPAAVMDANSIAASAGPCDSLPAGTILRVDSPERIKLSSLWAGDQLSAVLPHPLFSGECQVLPAGTPLRLHVSEVTRVKQGRESSQGWTSGLRKPFELLSPRHKRVVEFRSSEIVLTDGTIVPFDSSLLDVRSASLVRTRNQGKPSTAKAPGEATDLPASDGSKHGPARKPRGSSLILCLNSPVTFPRQPDGAGGARASPERVHPEEARVRLRLLQPLSATRNELGQTFLARVLEPLQLGNQVVVPEGSTIQGEIVHWRPPRRLRRAAQLRLAFGKVNLPDGGEINLAASVTALEALQNSRMTLDKEGTLRASAATKKRAVIDLGLAYVVGKVVDDLLEEGLKAGAGAAATGSITTVARYVGLAAGTAFFFAHRGRDVALPKFTEMVIVVTRREGAGTTGDSANTD
jgi:hypothetical protein